MNRTGVRGYDTANAWLQGGRSKSKNERSLYETGVRLIRDSPTEISVILKHWGNSRYTHLVTYRSDGITVIHPGWKWQSIRRIITEYVPNLTMVIRKGQLVISLPTDGMTPPKISKCRTCSGIGTKPKECYGPGYRCWDDDCEQFAATKPMREKAWRLPWGVPERNELEQLIRLEEHKHATCKHGSTVAHKLYNDRYDCFRCRTTGKVDYGSKQRGRVWDNRSPIGIDANGHYIEV